MRARWHLLHAGYVEEDGVSVGSSVSLILDGAAVVVVDPGLVADRSLITGPLAEQGLTPDRVTHVVLTHHHPDHTINAALFPDAAVVDAWAYYQRDRWDDHEGDGHRISPNVRIILTPGHTRQDLTVLAETDDGVVAFTHAWWRTDRTPEVDPLAEDRAALDASRRRILAEADQVVPGHGGPFRTGR
ncbi:MAG: MBL fold metallo-hydrolase [Candidatus Limnocylindria bacterium]